MAEKILPKPKQAQMKIQQMAFMLIAVFLFFALVGLFVLVFQFSDLKESAELLEEQNAMLLVSKLADSPEFSCGEAFGTKKINCIDTDKIMMLKSNINKYENFWGVENIEIRKIYPEDSGICDLENYPDCGLIRLISENVEGTGISNFVALCRKEYNENFGVYDKCVLGKLIVSYSSK